jgi:sugar phosphate isomerase/epimerase
MSGKLAFNSYTLRDLMNTPENVEKTLRRAVDVGYSYVEVDLESLLLQFDRSELKDLLANIGLKAFSAHVEFERLEYGMDDAIEDYKFLGLEYVVVPNLPRDRFCKDKQGYLVGTKMLESFAEKLNLHGIKFAYHNHAKEFEKFDRKTGMEIIFDDENWKNYLSEIDVYWVQYGGGDPAQWIRKMSGRVPLTHIKDLGMVDGKPYTLEVGEGNMNWPYILEACKESGVEWYIVEQDDSLQDPVQSIKISRDFLNRMGIT